MSKQRVQAAGPLIGGSSWPTFTSRGVGCCSYTLRACLRLTAFEAHRAHNSVRTQFGTTSVTVRNTHRKTQHTSYTE
eukprot:8385865-Pyramimonas_sp.AAC.1